MSNSIIGGLNNTITSTCNIVYGSNNTSICGSTGYQGTAGPAGYMVSTLEITISKYGNRFILMNYEINDAFRPSIKLVDNYTLKEHTFSPINMISIEEEFQEFLNNIIITDRDTKIENILNESKD
jgi:hypothetical protein